MPSGKMLGGLATFAPLAPVKLPDPHVAFGITHDQAIADMALAIERKIK